MQKTKKFYVAFVAAFVIAGCGTSNPSTSTSASNISQGVCTAEAKQNVYDELFRLADNGEAFPNPTDLASELNKSLRARYNTRAGDDAQVQALADSIATMAADITSEIENPSSIDDEEAGLNLTPKEKILRRLARMELGDHSSTAKVNLQARIQASSMRARQIASGVLDCSSSPTGGGGSSGGGTSGAQGAMLDAWKSSQNSSVYGAWKTMAISYQSCDAVDVPPLSASTPPAVGISVLTRAAASGGKWREITNLPSFLQSNPYLKSYAKPASSCFAVQSHPLIYDFGGKPLITASEINLFKDAGSGATTSLGVDCSGFIATAELSAGLKPKSSTPIRPSYASAIGSNDFRDPSGNLDLDCLQKVSFSPSSYELQAGDIIAINGHVIMVDSVGADPLGIKGITSAADCASANIGVSKFNFSVIQSSPYKGALGIQRSVAADYVGTEPTIASGLVSYAIAACKARLGTSSTPSLSTLSVVRHSTSAACSSSEVALTNESCVASCPQ